MVMGMLPVSSMRQPSNFVRCFLFGIGFGLLSANITIPLVDTVSKTLMVLTSLVVTDGGA